MVKIQNNEGKLNSTAASHAINTNVAWQINRQNTSKAVQKKMIANSTKSHKNVSRKLLIREALHKNFAHNMRICLPKKSY